MEMMSMTMPPKRSCERNFVEQGRAGRWLSNCRVTGIFDRFWVGYGEMSKAKDHSIR
jgi:hypothetical protein